MSAPGITTITVVGANLFVLAAQYYGDATAWNRIAAANGLFDFIVTGEATLRIPPPDAAAANGGVLGV